MKPICKHIKKLKWFFATSCFYFYSCSSNPKVHVEESNYFKFIDEFPLSSADFDPSPLAFVPSAQRMELMLKNYPLERFELDYSELINTHKIVDAQSYIVKKAEDADILILNEAHHVPTHRRFARALLNDLWQANYRYFGLEALTFTENFNQPTYPENELGYYCNEPTFGLLIREAISLGFTLFPYEYTGPESGKLREQAQADHIAAFMANHTAGKTFIYCGYAHNFECAIMEWEKAMAGHLAERVDGSILTVNQHYFNDIAGLNSEKPVILLDSLNQPYRYDDCTDLFVFHPVYDYGESRCNWKADENTHWKKIDFIPKTAIYPVLVFAYYNESEVKNGVPYDCIELTNPSQTEWLLLPKNQPYKIVAIDRLHNEVPLNM